MSRLKIILMVAIVALTRATVVVVRPARHQEAEALWHGSQHDLAIQRTTPETETGRQRFPQPIATKFKIPWFDQKQERN